MYQRIRLPAGALLAAACALAGAQEVSEEQVRAFLDGEAKGWISDPLVVKAVKAQNKRHADLSQDEVQALDRQWRAETGAADRPLIDRVLGNPVSEYLRQRQAEGQGLVTEVFIMDGKGLNVGQSDVTSDYWQGDEAKWQKTFLAGPGAVFIDEVEYDESSQRFQVQVSVPVTDPDSQAVIGAMTVGLDAEQLLN